MTDTVLVKMEDGALPETELHTNSGSSDTGSSRIKISNAHIRVKLRNVRLRKPNWTLRESQDLLDEFEKHKMILNSRGNTGLSTKAKRKLAWTGIAQKINSKGHSAVKRTVYECKRRWKNMVTFAKLSILEFVKAIKLGGDPTKKVSEMDRRITEVHGDLKLLQTLQFAEQRDLDALSDVVELEPATEGTGGLPRTDENIGFSPTSIFGNHPVHVTSSQQSNRSQQSSQNSRQYFSDTYAMDSDSVSQSFEEQTPSIDNYYSLQAANQEHFNNTGQSGQNNDHDFGEEPRYYRGVSLDSEDPQEAVLRRRKLQLEVEKLQLEKEVLEMQKVKIRLETKAWRKMVGQRTTPTTQTPPPFAMTPFYWPSPTPGFPAFYGTSPNIGHPGMSQIHPTTQTMTKKE